MYSSLQDVGGRPKTKDLHYSYHGQRKTKDTGLALTVSLLGIGNVLLWSKLNLGLS